MKNMLVLVLIAVLCAACASSPKRAEGNRVLARYEGYIGAPIRDFTAFRQDSWQSVSRTQLILWTDMSHAYLLTITGNCPDLMFTDGIRVTSTGSSISTFDSVIVRGDRCPIQEIRPIDIRQMRADEKELRDNPQPAKPDPAP
jgi:hypothetical protein